MSWFRKFHIPLPGAALTLLAFFLPWLSVSCQGTTLAEGSGYEIASGSFFEQLSMGAGESDSYFILFLIPAIAILAVILVLLTMRDNALEKKTAGGHILLGMIGLSAPVVIWLQNRSSDMGMLTIEWEYGFWLTIVGLLIMIVGGILSYMEAKKAIGAEYYDAYPQFDAQPVIPSYSPPLPTPTTESSPAIGGATRATDFADLSPTGAPAPPSRKTEVINRQPKALAWLVVREGPRTGHTFNVAESTRIGRDADNDIIIDDTSMSGQHAKIKLEEGDQFMLYDLASTNGVFAYDVGKNDWERVYRHPLVDGQQIKLGRTILSFMHLSRDVPGANA